MLLTNDYLLKQILNYLLTFGLPDSSPDKFFEVIQK